MTNEEKESRRMVIITAYNAEVRVAHLEMERAMRVQKVVCERICRDLEERRDVLLAELAKV